MAEGGVFPWKRQAVDTHRGPATSYRHLQVPLPAPPKNTQWVHNEKSKEWRVEPVEESPVVDAVVIDDEANLPRINSHHLHTIQATDTFQGLCLRYKVTPTELRQANCFSGSNLSLAPNPLRIPDKWQTGEVPRAIPVNHPTKEEQIQQVLCSCPGLARSEARCFLELNDWNTEEALMDAQADYEQPLRPNLEATHRKYRNF